MSQHPSLSSSDKHKKHKSVLKRYERIKELKEKEKWKEGDSVFGLPKLKIIRFKIRKEKAKAEETVAAEGAGAGAPPPQAGPSLGQAKEPIKKEAAREKAK